MSDPKRIRLEDGTLWPTPAGAGDTAWRVIHGDQPPDRGDVLFLASVASAYIELMTRPDYARKPAMMRRALRPPAGKEDK